MGVTDVIYLIAFLYLRAGNFVHSMAFAFFLSNRICSKGTNYSNSPELNGDTESNEYFVKGRPSCIFRKFRVGVDAISCRRMCTDVWVS